MQLEKDCICPVGQHPMLTFLGPADLPQFGRPLPQSLRVGAPIVAVHLRVSGVELPRRAGLTGGHAGRDELWDS